MQETDWPTIGEYLDKDALKHAQALLHSHDIPFFIESPEDHLNTGFGLSTSLPFALKVPEAHLAQAQQLLGNVAADEGPAEAFSLADYTQEELEAIVLNPEEWHESFITQAKALLAEKKVAVSDAEVDELTAEKVRQLEEGRAPNAFVFYGLWFIAILGGFMGVIAGLYFWQGTFKAFNGKRYYYYSIKYRQLGFFMFLTGLIALAVSYYIYFRYDLGL